MSVTLAEDRPCIADASRPQEATFLRRVLAFVIDCALIAALFAVLCSALFAVSGGTIQGSGLTGDCTPVEIDPDWHTTSSPGDKAQLCASDVLGFTAHRSVSIKNDADIRQWFLIDAQGKRVDALDLNQLEYPLFVAYLIVAASMFGSTFGKRLAGLRIEHRGKAISLFRCALRELVKLCCFIPLLVSLWLGSKAGPLEILPIWLWLIANLVAVALGRDTLYDRLAGTKVVRSK